MLAIEMLVKSQWVPLRRRARRCRGVSDVRARAEALRIANDARKRVLLWRRELTAATPPSAAAKPDPGRSARRPHRSTRRAPQRDPRAPHRDHGHHRVGCRPGYRFASSGNIDDPPERRCITRIAGEDQAIRRAGPWPQIGAIARLQHGDRAGDPRGPADPGRRASLEISASVCWEPPAVRRSRSWRTTPPVSWRAATRRSRSPRIASGFCVGFSMIRGGRHDRPPPAGRRSPAMPSASSRGP